MCLVKMHAMSLFPELIEHDLFYCMYGIMTGRMSNCVLRNEHTAVQVIKLLFIQCLHKYWQIDRLLDVESQGSFLHLSERLASKPKQHRIWLSNTTESIDAHCPQGFSSRAHLNVFPPE